MGKDSSSAYKGKSHDKKPYTGKSGFHKLLGTGSKSDRSSEKSSGASSISTGFSFLFVVNELVLRQDARPNVDQWGTRMPPDSGLDYDGEIVGEVWRYRDGEVTRAHRYSWDRGQAADDVFTGLRAGGGVCYYDEHGAAWPMPAYSRFTVFNGWGPLPVMYARVDALSTSLGPAGDGARWNVMSFRRHDHSGVTRVAEAGNAQVVEGRDPSWIPSLVPEIYRNKASSARASRGLGGELGVIIGQMALTESHGYTDQVFENGWWNNRNWMPQRDRSPMRDPLDIRGVVVSIFLDTYENPDGSTRDAIRAFENGVVVKE